MEKKLSSETIFKNFAKEITGRQQQKSNQKLAKQSFEHTNRAIEKIKESEGEIDDFSSSESRSIYSELPTESSSNSLGVYII